MKKQSFDGITLKNWKMRPEGKSQEIFHTSICQKESAWVDEETVKVRITIEEIGDK